MSKDTATLKSRLDAASTPDELLALSEELMPLTGGALDLDLILAVASDCIAQGHRDKPKSRAVRSAKIEFIRLHRAIEEGDILQATALGIHLALRVDSIDGNSAGQILDIARKAKQQKTAARHLAIREKFHKLRETSPNITAARRDVLRWANECDAANARLPEDSSMKAEPLNWGERTIRTATRGMK